MPIIKQFGGIVPRVSWANLPLNCATVAHDVKLRNGKLEPWREKLAIAQAVQDAVAVHFHGCCPYTFDTCVDMAEYVTDYSRLYFTGRKDYPEVASIGSNCALTYYRLGVPKPTVAPTVVGTESMGRQCSARSYVYTFVNVFGEEGAPSPASQQLTVADGTAIAISGFTTPATEYGVQAINIYRTATVLRDGTEKTQEPGTEFLFVAQVPIGTLSYADTVLEKMLGEVLTTDDNREPPKELRHITYMRGTGVLSGVTTNQVHFCQAYQPSNWPAEHDLTLPYNIVHAVSLGSKLFVTTDSYPYVINGAQSCEAKQCRSVDSANTPLPDISCGHVNGAIATPFGAIYASKDGIVLVNPSGQFQIISSAWFSTDDWIKIRPETARFAYWRGYLICVTDAISFMLEIDGGTYNDIKTAELVTISDSPVEMTVTQSDELIMLQDSMLWHWNAGSTYRSYRWESREMGFGGESTPTVAKVRTDGITLRIMGRDSAHAFERFVPDEMPVRLKRLGRERNWRLRLSGKGTVEYIALGMRFNAIEGNSTNGNQL